MYIKKEVTKREKFDNKLVRRILYSFHTKIKYFISRSTIFFQRNQLWALAEVTKLFASENKILRSV